MFSTFDSAALEIPPVFDYEDERWWAYVNVPLFSVYFHVVIEFDEAEESRVSKTVLYDHVSQIIGSAAEPEIDVREIQVVLPSSWAVSPCPILAKSLVISSEFR